MKKAVIFGGSGFIGKHMVSQLVARDYCVSVVTRRKDNAARLKVMGKVGQVVIKESSLLDNGLIEKLVSDHDLIINLLGTINNPKKAVLKYLHVALPYNMAKFASKYGKKFVHFSAMAAGIAPNSAYSTTKLEGEKMVCKVCADAIIIRPNVVYGDEDKFFQKFARLACVLPMLFTIGKGNNMLQPVYVGDVVNFTMNIVENVTKGGIYEICGPQAYSFKDLMRLVLDTTLRKKPIVRIPFFIARIIAVFCEFKIVSFLLKPITGNTDPMITRDQLELLRCNIIPNGAATECIAETTLESMMPKCLEIYKKQ